MTTDEIKRVKDVATTLAMREDDYLANYLANFALSQLEQMGGDGLAQLLRDSARRADTSHWSLYHRLSEPELAAAINACHWAGAANAARALNKHVTRMQIDNDSLRQQVSELQALLEEYTHIYCTADGCWSGCDMCDKIEELKAKAKRLLPVAADSREQDVLKVVEEQAKAQGLPVYRDLTNTVAAVGE